ncbi:NAD(P)H-dependent oxidoreductase [Manganibacter manganicus]|uniref:NAD(P)H dehydrogenase n=1 Tax=Manganibacter manganicus TaxID=1873176 RepID=A0A1V8RUU6_9HYPH|nr:NAD(P)H-dependent oxidoreductase [Pseudaminobacter manganicus]OQM76918.1 NAD(P)H dehydrogenase [Pseudaminobacter manganicus]
MKTLILSFHPEPRHSVTNAALARAANALDGVEVIDMQTLYPSGHIDMFTDGAVEAERLLSADHIVLQFPVQWYSVPTLMKAWMDAVLTRMFYLFHETEGAHLEGTPVMLAATAGNVPEAYTPKGQNLIPLVNLLNPLRAMAYRCKLRWEEPFLVYRAGKLSEAELAEAATRYAETLRAWAARPVEALAA